MTANNPITSEQLDELMTVAVNMQRDSEKAGDRPSAMFAYAVQVAVLELRKVRNDAAALAALEAEAVCVTDQSNLDYLKSGSDADVWPASRTEMGDVLLYRTAPPAAVFVPDITALDNLAGEMLNHAMNCERRVAVAYTHCAHRLAEEVRDLRAAMLQGDDGNSPVIPDGWVACSERMPEREVDVQVYCSDKKEQMVGYMERNERNGYFRFASLPNGGGVYCQPTHWMPLPAAPQQEAE